MDTVSAPHHPAPAGTAPAASQAAPAECQRRPDRPAQGLAMVAGLRAAALAAAPALAGYALLRLVGLLVLAVFAHRAGASFWPLLGRFDGIWYQDIATGGYDTAIPHRPDGSLTTTNLAFFPLYPALIALADPVLPGGTLPAGLAVSWLAGLAAAAGLYAIGAQLAGRRAGIALAGLWAVVPHAFVESMTYTETLFTALAAWSLYAVLHRRWLAAGTLCLVAGLVRPTASALVAAVGLACLVAALRRRDGWRPWLAGALAPLGFAGYLSWVGYRLDRWDGYFYLQDAAWGMPFDGGRYTWRMLNTVLTKPQALQPYAVTAVLAVALVLFALAVLDRQPWPLLVYSGAVLALTLTGGGYYHSKARLVLPAFSLLLPAAVGLAKARPRTMVVVFCLLALVSAWYGSYLALVWKYSP